MKRFEFPLQALLEQRQRVEEARQRELAVELRQMARVEEGLRGLEASVAAEHAALRDGHLTGRIDLSLLAAHRRFLLGCERRRAELLTELSACRQRVERARALLTEAATARKVVERLRERRYAQWKSAVFKAEQDELDDAVSSLRVYRLQCDRRVDGSSF